jgi:hypothetical protein
VKYPRKPLTEGFRRVFIYSILYIKTKPWEALNRGLPREFKKFYPRKPLTEGFLNFNGYLTKL